MAATKKTAKKTSSKKSSSKKAPATQKSGSGKARPVEFGLTLSGEEHSPARLVDLAELAERSGFDFVSISDHYHPWIDAQGHAPFVWTLLGAIAERTQSLGVGVGVTCPIMRIHPAVLAQATATTANLLPDRFVWGVGTGEALNEHILGDKWPPAPQRLEMLEEAVDIIRRLWTGDEVSHLGFHFEVENARIYDPPPGPLPIIVSAFGPKATELAARIGDGLWVTGPDASTISHFRDSGGTGPVYCQLTVCWGEDREAAIDLAHEVWPNSGVTGQLSQDLPTPAHFEQAAKMVTRDDIGSSLPCGPDVGPIIEGMRAAIDAGVDHLYIHQIGPDQEGFCSAWVDEIAPEFKRAGKR